tara:strand:- start:206 stop:505 length:300 start_codon:yes stop_codon:yes gene_type:complete
MSIQVTKVNFTGYVIVDSEKDDDPRKWQSNKEDLSTVLEACMANSFKCTMDIVDSIGEIGCDCTECTCQPNTSEVLTITNLDQPGESADTIIEEKELSL